MTDKEQMSRGDALAKVAALEAELAELRGRVCVPEGYVVVPVEPSAAMAIAGREFAECGIQGNAVFCYRAMLAAATAPVERNQCDGCQAGIPVEGGMHRMGKPGGYADLMACTAERYGSAPVEQVGQEPLTYLRFRSYRIAADDVVEGFEVCKKDDRGDDGELAIPVYPAPQPAAPAPDVAGLVEALRSIYDEDYQAPHDATDFDVSESRKQCIYRIRRKVKDALATFHREG